MKLNCYILYLTAAYILQREKVEHEAYRISQLQQFFWVTEIRKWSFQLKLNYSRQNSRSIYTRHIGTFPIYPCRDKTVVLLCEAKGKNILPEDSNIAICRKYTMLKVIKLQNKIQLDTWRISESLLNHTDFYHIHHLRSWATANDWNIKTKQTKKAHKTPSKHTKNKPKQKINKTLKTKQTKPNKQSPPTKTKTQETNIVLYWDTFFRCQNDSCCSHSLSPDTIQDWHTLSSTCLHVTSPSLYQDKN